MIEISQLEMAQRLVRYEDLKPCTTAFIDTRTAGSNAKENFTIIGPGVAENPEQHVHIGLAHGFNIGGARQPPGCVNSQHSHETAEVFVIHTGQWRFMTGVDASDGHVDLGPGDVISIPTRVFRGFQNVGVDLGFMFSVLGGDDPGRVTWAPYVFTAASSHGLLLLENGRLIDTTQESVPADAVRMRPTTQDDVARFDRYDSDAIARCVVRAADLRPSGGLSQFRGFEECPILGGANPRETMQAGVIAWKHGFQLRALRIAVGARSLLHTRQEEEVLLMHSGSLEVSWPTGTLTLRPGDTLTVPVGLPRKFNNPGKQPAVAYVVRGGDQPTPARLLAQR